LTRVSPSAFPELRRFFSGYLHEDFLVETGTPDAALRAFWADADAGERRRFQREARRFLTRTATLEFDLLRDLIRQLGCRWMPPSREALVDFLTAAARLPEAPSG
jgi:hypothetical protein